MTRRANRLANEASPYLRQHGENPVDWYPWGPEALARARLENKPILLSIGYAACHWCHVMQHESFEDAAIAEEMNRLFVNVKVDREERPDLDHVYQLVVQLMGRGGGWPLTVFLTPEQRPFFAGTYFPPQDRHGMPGFPKVLAAIAEAYRERRDDVEQQAQELTQAIGRVYGATAQGGAEPGPELLARASKKLLARFDEQNGGFGKRPKFPNTMSLEVLLRRGVLEGDATARASAELTLQHMREGGLWDQLRGGFHRYSTDERWLVPHFEKMLYDNALLLRLYVDGHRAFGDETHADTARRLVAYLFAEMRDVSGPFYASQDADSEGHEGRFFVWTEAELEQVLADEPAALEVAKLHFGVTRAGNFEGSGSTVLSAARPIAALTVAVGRGPSEVRALIERAREKLLAAREARPRPLRDDKLLVAWNGLLISALAEGGRALCEPTWVEAACQAFDALERTLVKGGEVRRYALPDGVPAGENKGFLDDHANLANAALDLYAATGEPRYVEVAKRIATRIREAFADDVGPGFYFTARDGEALISRTQDGYDQAVPSGASMAALLFLRLGELGYAALAEPGEAYLRAVYTQAADDAFAFGQTVLVLDRLVRGSVDVVVVGRREDARTKALVDEVFAVYLPNKNVVLVDPERPGTALAAPALAEGKTAGDGPRAYVCRGRVCSAPVETAEALRGLLRAG